MDILKNNVVIFAVVVISVLTLIWGFQGVDGYTDLSSHYARLGDGYNSQLFSPCVSKRCSGGPYMYTDNPYLQSVCATESSAQCASCGRGFKHGPPVKFEYSNLSNGAWDNVLCNKSTGSCGLPHTTSLCVL
jgi:hypothetical protein